MSEDEQENSPKPRLNDTAVVTLKNAVTAADHASGPETASVTLLEYGNFQCIDCGRAFPVIKKVQRLLGNNLRFVFRHFPAVRSHPRALRAAEATEAAAAQGKFWEMHDQLFEHQKALEDPDLLRHAKHINLDTVRFGRDMTENTFLRAIETEYNRSLFDEHVTGTPTFYINEVRFIGRSDIQNLLEAIRRADTDGRIQLPEHLGRIQTVLGRLRRGKRN